MAPFGVVSGAGKIDSVRTRALARELSSKMLKNQTIVIDLETRGEWRVDARTKGPDHVGADGKLAATWVVVLSNKQGERRFVPEHRFKEFFEVPGATK